MPELTYAVPELPADSSLRDNGPLTAGERHQILAMILQAQVRAAVQQLLVGCQNQGLLFPQASANSIAREVLSSCLEEITGG